MTVTKEITEQLNRKINSEHIFTKVTDQQKRSVITVGVSDKNFEIEKAKENGYFVFMGGNIFAVCSVFFHTWYSAVLPSNDPFQGNGALFDLLIGGGIALTAFIAYLKTKKNYPRVKRNILAFSRTGLLETFENYEIEKISGNLKNILLATDSNLEDQNKIVYLFAEHFCNILEVSEISQMVDTYSADRVPPEVIEMEKRQINRALKSLIEDSRYIAILNKYRSDKMNETIDSFQKREYNSRKYNRFETLKIS